MIGFPLVLAWRRAEIPVRSPGRRAHPLPRLRLHACAMPSNRYSEADRERSRAGTSRSPMRLVVRQPYYATLRERAYAAYVERASDEGGAGRAPLCDEPRQPRL